jgi:hypothetical protein
MEDDETCRDIFGIFKLNKNRIDRSSLCHLGPTPPGSWRRSGAAWTHRWKWNAWEILRTGNRFMTILWHFMNWVHQLIVNLVDVCWYSRVFFRRLSHRYQYHDFGRAEELMKFKKKDWDLSEASLGPSQPSQASQPTGECCCGSFFKMPRSCFRHPRLGMLLRVSRSFWGFIPFSVATSHLYWWILLYKTL